MARYTLTIRNGPKVTREKFDLLEDAVAAMRGWAERVRAEGDLPDLSMIRTYESADRVHARLEVSTGRWLRSKDAGVDVMGDGALVPFRGGTFRKRLDLEGGETAFEAVERAMVE